MPGQKTIENDASVEGFIAAVENDGRRADAAELLELMKRVTGLEPKMWGPSIIGFGRYHYKYDSGHEGDSFLTGFSPRKANLVVYIMPGFSEYGALMEKLGKYKTGRSCLYLGRLSGIDQQVLAKLVDKSVKWMKKKYEV